MMTHGWLMLLLLVAPLVQAAGVHAFLDRNRVSLGDTVTLNITTDGALGNPDLSALARDFKVLGSSRSSSLSLVNGKRARRAQIGIALQPLHAGTLTIPALSVAGTHTQPLTLVVTAAPSGGQGRVGDPAFLEATVPASSPYVGQETIYTVRLYYLPGVHGTLSDPTARGAELIALDRDHRSMAERNGYAYQVLERSWALIPDRSGEITVAGPVFHGQALGIGNLNGLLQNPNQLFNNPNALLNAPFPGTGTTVRASAPAVTIDARAAPAGAGTPWLPARNVRLQLTGLPASGQLQAGVPVTVTLQVSAEGVPATALPEPELPALAGARVYPDATQDATDTSGEWLRATRTRSFAIVPEAAGTLTIPAITLNWWDVTRARAERATLPARALAVAASTAATGTSATPSGAATATSRNMAVAAAPAAGGVRWWRDLAIAGLGLWLLVALAVAGWWWRHRWRARVVAMQVPEARPDPEATRTKPAAASASAPVQAAIAQGGQREVLAAAAGNDVAACARALLAWARASRPELANLTALCAALADPDQCAALVQLQRARWQGGDPGAALRVVAAAFASGLAWRTAPPAGPGADKPGLPPLYPAP